MFARVGPFRFNFNHEKYWLKSFFFEKKENVRRTCHCQDIFPKFPTPSNHRTHPLISARTFFPCYWRPPPSCGCLQAEKFLPPTTVRNFDHFFTFLKGLNISWGWCVNSLNQLRWRKITFIESTQPLLFWLFGMILYFFFFWIYVTSDISVQFGILGDYSSSFSDLTFYHFWNYVSKTHTLCFSDPQQS